MRKNRASDNRNDVNGACVSAPGVASGRGLEVPQVVIMRNPQPSIISFYIEKIIGDGNCLFRAISLELLGHQRYHRKIRKDAVTYIGNNWHDIKEHLLTEDDNLKSKDNYLKYMEKDGIYGTSLEVLAISEAHEVDILIYLENKRPEGQTYSTDKKAIKISKRMHEKSIHLLLSGKPEEGHFDLLIPYNKNPGDGKRKEKRNSDRKRTSDKANEKSQKLHSHQEPLKEQQTNQENNHKNETQPETKKRTRNKWTTEEYVEILWCHFYTVEKTGTANQKKTFELWKKRNPFSRHNMTPNTLATQRRVILNNNKIDAIGVQKIQRSIKEEINKELGQEEITNNQILCDSDLQNLEKTGEETSSEKKYSSAENSTIDPDFEELILKQVHVMTNEDISIARNPLKKINENSRVKLIISKVNTALENIFNMFPEDFADITLLNKLMYASASVVQNILLPEGGKERRGKQKPENIPPWKKRIQSKITRLRKELSQLKETEKPELSRKMLSVKEELYKKHKIRHDRDREKVAEKIKQKILAKTSRINRYERRSKQYQQNKLYSENATRFYNNVLNKNVDQSNKTPNNKDIETYWNSIWGKGVSHNQNARWIDEERQENNDVKEMEWTELSMEELRNALSRAANWKAPGTDGITNFWLKRLEATHKKLLNCYNNMITGTMATPEWLVKGKTHLLPKNEKTELPSNYRPITCLNTTYKALTSIMTARLYKHLEKNNLFPAEQKGCAKNTYGCKDHLLVSKMISDDCRERHKNLSIAWVDYKKAFDSIPHSWLLESLEIYKASHVMIAYIKKLMEQWKVDLHLKTESQSVCIENIRIKNGIYQGDSLSPLLFCIALIPLSSQLNRLHTGYQCKNERTKVSNLLYVDDLKLIAKDDSELETQLKIVKEYSDDIQMEFGLEKCAKVTMTKGKITKRENIKLDEKTVIRSLEEHKLYKYLGVEENEGINHKFMKKKICQEYLRRIRAILKTELTARNKLSAITALAVPVVQYSFGIVKWTLAEIRTMDRKTRKLLTMHGALHPRSDVDRLYVSRRDGGRGLTNLEISYSIATQGIAKYLELKQRDKYLGMVYRRNTKMYQENISEDNTARAQPHTETEQVKKFKEDLKKKKKMELRTRWKTKKMHGQILKETEKNAINEVKSWEWLKIGDLKVETEALITACQEQSIATNYLKAKVLKTGTDPNCRLCRSEYETIHHVVSGCPILAKKEYLERHNAVAAHLHWNICKTYGIKVSDKWYEHKPEPVVNTDELTLLWDSQIQTDRKINANKPDLVLKDKTKKVCLLIDVAIPLDYNITQKEAEKRLKYKDLEIEIRRMWDMKTKVIPVIIGATGLISHSTCAAIKEIPGKHHLLSLQKTVLLKTAHIVRKVL